MSAALLLGALALDASFGEPRAVWSRVPHPAILLGRVVAWLDLRLNSGPSASLRRLKGALALALLAALALGVGGLLSTLGWAIEGLVVAILLAQRSLVDHVRAVAIGLRTSLEEGRHAVAMIVSRDTSQMDQSAVARSAIESASENLSDGVIAPAFWYLMAGLPGLLLYKAVNTADSMIGYRTPRHEAFGWAAARFDDLLNLIPARLTAALIALAYGQVPQWRAIRRDAGQHRSPNAGWPEAAMSRALGLALAGPRSYDGALRDFPFVHETGRKHLSAADIDAATRALWLIWAFFALLVLLCALLGV